MERTNNVVRIPIHKIEDFFRLWVVFLTPLHHLTNREIDVIVAILIQRYRLSLSISDPELLEEVLMNTDTKRKVKAMCNMNENNFQVVMCKLRKNKVIINIGGSERGTEKYIISPKFIPNINSEDTKAKLTILFELTCNTQQ